MRGNGGVVPTGRDELCGLRFVTIKVTASRPSSQPAGDGKSFGDLSKGKVSGAIGVQLFKRRLRYCYECGRSIG